MRTVNIYLLHNGDGKKNSDFNTTFELDQIAASVNLHLKGVTINAAYNSDMNRAHEAVVHAIITLNQQVQTYQHIAFFIPTSFAGEFGAKLKRAEIAAGKNGTVADFFREYGGQALGRDIARSLKAAAGEVALLHPGKTNLNALIGYHAPLIALPAMNPEMMPINMGFADMVRYTLTNDGTSWTITDSVHLLCPLVKTIA